MKRRKFIMGAGVGMAAAPLAAPAVAQGVIRWRLASSFPKSLDTIYGAGEVLAKRVTESSGGKFEIRVFAAGEIVPGLQVLDAVQAGTVECGHTANYYYVGKDPTFAFDTAVPFGLNSRQQTAWMIAGGGQQLMSELFKAYNVVAHPAGNTGCQMGGFFRKEIRSTDDLKGLKFRIAGLGGTVMQRLGAVPQQLPPGDIYPALERGTIDAAEFVGPYDDERLGLIRVAPFYYFPGFWEPGSQLSLNVNLEAWNKLPDHYKAIVQAAAAQANVELMARYDAWNALAIRRLVAAGAQLRPFSREIMAAAWTESHKLYDELAASNAVFKKVYDNWRPFRDQQFQWARVADNTFENFAFTASQTVR